MPNISFNTKEELINFKEGLLSNLDKYYDNRIEELRTERVKTETLLIKQLHRMNLIALGLIAIIVTAIISLTVLLYGSSLNIVNEANANSEASVILDDKKVTAKDGVEPTIEFNGLIPSKDVTTFAKADTNQTDTTQTDTSNQGEGEQ